MGNKWTLTEPEQRDMNLEIENLDIFSVPDSSLYHYTCLLYTSPSPRD